LRRLLHRITIKSVATVNLREGRTVLRAIFFRLVLVGAMRGERSQAVGPRCRLPPLGRSRFGEGQSAGLQ
jgi:hypothetical protein